jgi:hypothetical protein
MLAVLVTAAAGILVGLRLQCRYSLPHPT